jgi:hypothetical protein
MDAPSPVSERKLEANRANALKSTGPRTEAGKARSARNATRHGLLAEAASLLAEPNQELESLLDNYRTDFRPASTHEEMLVRELAVSDWRLRQITRTETGLMSVSMQQAHKSTLQPDEPDPEAEAEPPSLAETSPEIRTALLGIAWINYNSTFALLMRYQNQARRDYFRALKQLELLRTGKAGYLPPEPPAQVAENQTKPNVAAPATAGAAAPRQTNPNAPTPDLPHIPTPEELRRLLGPLEDDLRFVRSK